MPIKIFFCYAREDEELLNKLKIQLKPFQRQGLIDLWHDRDISAGTEWEREISRHLNEADIILLLVSPDFMNSDYCYSIEMKRALTRHKHGTAKVIPIILSYVHWQGEPLGKLQALPTDAKPVISASWYNLNEALFDVAEGIRKVIEKLGAFDEIFKLISHDYELEDLFKSDAFNMDCKNAIILAQDGAKRFSHNYIGTEHLLFGLLLQREGVATKILIELGIKPEMIKDALEFIIGGGEPTGKIGKIGITPRAQKVIALTVEEARRMNHRYIGTEHLLLGLAHEGEGIAAGVLESLGVSLDKLRDQVLNFLK